MSNFNARQASSIAALTLLIALLTGAFFWLQTPDGKATNEEDNSFTLPHPQDLPAINLPDFLVSHPRLPSPSPAEIAQLRRQNADFFKRQRISAKGGKGDFYASILMTHVEPDSQNLDLLHNRLMTLQFTGRGHDQVKPLSIAYDWLYKQWSREQGAAATVTHQAGGRLPLCHRCHPRGTAIPLQCFSLQQPLPGPGCLFHRP